MQVNASFHIIPCPMGRLGLGLRSDKGQDPKSRRGYLRGRGGIFSKGVVSGGVVSRGRYLLESAPRYPGPL